MSDFIEKIKTIPNLSIGNGCSEKQLADAQAELGIAFPPELKGYLLTFGSIDFYGTVWLGIGEINGKEIKGERNIVFMTQRVRKDFPDCPKDLLILEDFGIDDRYAAVGTDGSVFHVHCGTCQKAYDSLSEYLDQCIRRREDDDIEENE